MYIFSLSGFRQVEDEDQNRDEMHIEEEADKVMESKSCDNWDQLKQAVQQLKAEKLILKEQIAVLVDIHGKEIDGIVNRIKEMEEVRVQCLEEKEEIEGKLNNIHAEQEAAKLNSTSTCQSSVVSCLSSIVEGI